MSGEGEFEMATAPTASEQHCGHPLLSGGHQTQVTTQLRILADDQIKDLHWATLEVLERTGVYVQHEEARDLLRGAGARVDQERVYIPSFLVESALRTAPSNVTIYRRTGEPLAFLGGKRVYFATYSEAAWILDPYTGQRRRFTSEDYRLIARATEASPYMVALGGGGAASDIPPEFRCQASFKYCTSHTTKALLVTTGESSGLADVVEMAAMIAGSHEQLRARPFILPKCEPTAPLSHVREAIEMLLMMARAGLPVVYYSMTAAGSTAPCSGAGALVVANAEVLSGLVIHQLARPGAPFVYGVMPGMMDMSTTVWAYGSPDFLLLSAAAAELSQYYHLPMMGTGGCSDAKDLDMQCAAEVALGCLLAAQSGTNLVHDVGLLDSTQMVSPAQIVLADEVLGMVLHLTRRVDTSAAGLQLDLIDRVGPRGEFLTAESTYRDFKEFWYPQVFGRRRYDQWQKAGAQSVLDRLNERTCKLIEDVEVRPLPAEVASDLDGREQKWRQG